uniref:Protein kinase domain-containing protein n=1 Tax=Octactis speculum TaxID=3111310 RepID=A0A7S2APM3_9STRA|mmetsp:Transcript_13386/g.17704  ORF Transcript_13386/g.17704 Transcript_13386/m.17704 type:complete len:401 (+) Transcript_13386:44-1246(+)
MFYSCSARENRGSCSKHWTNIPEVDAHGYPTQTYLFRHQPLAGHLPDEFEQPSQAQSTRTGSNFRWPFCSSVTREESKPGDTPPPPSNPPNHHEHYKLGPVLGKGRTSRVYDARDIRSHKKVALKIVGGGDHALGVHYANEKRALMAVSSKYIIQLIEFSDSTFFLTCPAHILVLEHCPNGDLFCILEKCGALKEAYARMYARQIFEALEACHSQSIFHRDLKPENILVSEDWTLKLADFGYASFDSRSTSGSVCGTTGYMAPELFTNSLYSPAMCDVWSAAVITFILLTAKPPVRLATSDCSYFRKMKESDWRGFWAAHEREVEVSAGAKQFLQRLLSPVWRPSVHHALQLPWLSETVDPSQSELSSFMRNKIEMPISKDSCTGIGQSILDGHELHAAA